MPPTSTLNAPLLKIIKVASIAAYLDDGPQLSSRMRQRIDEYVHPPSHPPPFLPHLSH